MPLKFIRNLLRRSLGSIWGTKLQLFDNPSFGGHTENFSASCDDLTPYFPNGVASIIVEQDSGPWQAFTGVHYQGNSKYLYPGNYGDLNELGLEKPVKSFRTAPKKLALKLFEKQNYGGTKKVFWASCDDLSNHFPEGTSSIVVNKHSERWQVFTEVQFKGATATLEPGGKYKDTEEMHLECPIKSFRKAPSGT